MSSLNRHSLPIFLNKIKSFPPSSLSSLSFSHIFFLQNSLSPQLTHFHCGRCGFVVVIVIVILRHRHYGLWVFVLRSGCGCLWVFHVSKFYIVVSVLQQPWLINLVVVFADFIVVVRGFYGLVVHGFLKSSRVVVHYDVKEVRIQRGSWVFGVTTF